MVGWAARPQGFLVFHPWKLSTQQNIFVHIPTAGWWFFSLNNRIYIHNAACFHSYFEGVGCTDTHFNLVRCG